MLTPEQLEYYRKKYNLGPNTDANAGLGSPVERIANLRASATKTNELEKYKQSAQGQNFLQKLKGVVTERLGNAKDVMKQTATGEIHPLSGSLQTLGQGAGTINDIIFEGLKAITPQPVKEAAKTGMSIITKQPDIANVIQSVNNWSEKHPEAAKNLEAAIDIAALFPMGKGARVGAKTITKGVKEGTELLGEGAKAVVKPVVKGGEKVLKTATETITPMERGVKTILQSGKTKLDTAGIYGKFDRYVSQAQEAVKDFSQATPMELAGTKAEKALTGINNKLKITGQRKKTLTEAIKSKPVGDIIATAKNDMQTMLKERTGSELTKDGLKNVKGRISSISDPSDIKLVKDVNEILVSLENKFPTFRKVDDAIDRIQDLLYKRQANLAVPVNSNVQSILKGVTKKLNDGLKEIGGAKYRALNDNYSYMVSIRDTLNKALGRDANKGAALMKQLFSPSGTMPRKLFAEIKKITGIDLVQEATLAKFAMENIGDVRQASLLEQVLKGSASATPKGVVRWGIEKGIEKLQNPVAKARSILNKELKNRPY